MTPGKFLYTIRRLAQFGLRHWYVEHFLTHRITAWRGDPNLPSADVPLHFLSSKHDWKMALWMLVSFRELTGRRWPLIFHEDGSLGDNEFDIFRAMFPEIRVITRREADSEMKLVLKNFSRCDEYRRKMPHAIKSFDIPHFCQSDRFLMIDPDVIFFQRPQEILEWVDHHEDKSCWFNRDFQEPSPISPIQAKVDLGIDLLPRVNSGLCMLHKATVSDLRAMESYLTHPALQNPNVQWRVEQTLLALTASREKRGGLLPPSYEVSPNKHKRSGCVARHYVGCVRDRFLSEGIMSLPPVFRSRLT